MPEDIRMRMEDQWFDAHEQELLRQAREKKRKEEQRKRDREEDEELRRLKELHWMKCPKCGQDMKEIEIAQVLVDQCDFCGGLFFDLGELDTLFSKKIKESKNFFRKLFKI